MKLTHNILKTIENYEMIKPGDKILIALSGGPDSVFLLNFLHSFEKKLKIKLFIAHMDHGIRGRESREDALFVKRLSKGLRIKANFKKLKKIPKHSKISLEERLRDERYKFFKASCKKFGTSIVATAHTMDDQAETVLMRIIKGVSLKGLIGIHPVRIDKKIRFIRPLIETEKKDIVSHLDEKGVDYRIDKTNFENKFLRNRIRNEVFPFLLKVNPRLKRSLSSMAESLREDYDFIESEKRKRIKVFTKGKSCTIPLCDVLMQPKAIRKEMVREALKSVGGNIKKFTYRHWKDVDRFISKAERNSSLDLPGSIKIRKIENRLVFE